MMYFFYVCFIVFFWKKGLVFKLFCLVKKCNVKVIGVFIISFYNCIYFYYSFMFILCFFECVFVLNDCICLCKIWLVFE